MKKVLLFIVFLFAISTVYPQAFLGAITKQCNLRAGPGTDYEILGSLRAGAQVFVEDEATEEEFYAVIVISTGKAGYVHKSFVRKIRSIDRNEDRVFRDDGSSTTSSPEIEVYNNTSRRLTLKLNGTVYYFSPKERKTLTLSSGYCSYVASVPNVIPYYGSESLDTGKRYSWEFYIVTRTR